ncbi:MAG: xylulokinase [Candidatus Dormibacteraeota bacterium]|nr:xylulokinase [Candidatus Dormibacteraeota bacterium]
MALVAGIDSSTQSCKVVIRDAGTGRLMRQGSAPHPDGTEVDPEAWWAALQRAIAGAGGLEDVAALAVGAQQHGMVCLDGRAQVVRPALLWNDTRSAKAAEELVEELPEGAGGWARAVGSVPLASYTITKLRWLAEHEPDSAARTERVCLPHDWLSWRLRGGGAAHLLTDRGDASGTGYWSPAEERYRPDLLTLAFGRRPQLPEVLGPATGAGETASGAVIGAGTGDNAAAALGLGATEGDLVLSVGTSGVAAAVSPTPTADPSGLVSGFADATGAFLPLACTLNAARVLDSAARLLEVNLDTFSELALQAPPGAGGLVLVPYLDGERTPNLPDARGALHGMTRHNLMPSHVARAAVEGLLCGLADGVDALLAQGVSVRRVLLIGGGARSEALRRLAPAILGVPVDVPAPSEYVADGAARQAAWALAGTPRPPGWETGEVQRFEADPTPVVREQYAAVRELVVGGPK